MTGSQSGANSKDDFCPINSLPLELLIHVFSCAENPVQLSKAQLVCRLWHSIINDPSADQYIWRPLSVTLSSSRLVPYGINGLTKGTCIEGKFHDTYDAKTSHWRYLYKDFVRNTFSYSKIKVYDSVQNSRQGSDVTDPDSKTVDPLNELKFKPATSSLPPLASLPRSAHQNAYVVRKFDTVHAATEGVRIYQASPLVTTKIASHSDALVPGEKEVSEAGWVQFADSPRLMEHFVRMDAGGRAPSMDSPFTLQKAVLTSNLDPPNKDSSNMPQSIDQDNLMTEGTNQQPEVSFYLKYSMRLILIACYG